jgi:hypothetical protein
MMQSEMMHIHGKKPPRGQCWALSHSLKEEASPVLKPKDRKPEPGPPLLPK